MPEQNGDVGRCVVEKRSAEELARASNDDDAQESQVVLDAAIGLHGVRSAHIIYMVSIHGVSARTCLALSTWRGSAVLDPPSRIRDGSFSFGLVPSAG